MNEPFQYESIDHQQQPTTYNNPSPVQQYLSPTPSFPSPPEPESLWTHYDGKEDFEFKSGGDFELRFQAMRNNYENNDNHIINSNNKHHHENSIMSHDSYSPSSQQNLMHPVTPPMTNISSTHHHHKQHLYDEFNLNIGNTPINTNPNGSYKVTAQQFMFDDFPSSQHGSQQGSPLMRAFSPTMIPNSIGNSILGSYACGEFDSFDHYGHRHHQSVFSSPPPPPGANLGLSSDRTNNSMNLGLNSDRTNNSMNLGLNSGGTNNSMFSFMSSSSSLLLPAAYSLPVFKKQKKKASNTADTNCDPAERDRNYECDMCLKRFFRSQDLKRHAVTHEKSIRPFKCWACPSSFTRADALQRHTKKSRCRLKSKYH